MLLAQIYNNRYRQQTHRLVYSSDIVPRVPPEFLTYRHVGIEHYLTTFGRVLTEQEAVKRWHLIEGLGFVPLQLYKVGRGLARRHESGLRSLYRLMLLILLPGLSDHYPADYVHALSQHARKQEL